MVAAFVTTEQSIATSQIRDKSPRVADEVVAASLSRDLSQDRPASVSAAFRASFAGIVLARNSSVVVRNPSVVERRASRSPPPSARARSRSRSPPPIASTLKRMHLDGLGQLEAVLKQEKRHREDDGQENMNEDFESVHSESFESKVSLKVFVALRRCSDSMTTAYVRDLLKSSLGAEAFKKRQGKAATWELLAELRSALRDERTPDIALATQLIRLGANLEARENGDYDTSGLEDPWSTDWADNDDLLQHDSASVLQLLALNRWADPEATKAAIKKALDSNVDPNKNKSEGGGSKKAPLILAMASKNVVAVQTLLEGGAKLNKWAMLKLRNISHTDIRRQLEEICMKHVPGETAVEWLEDEIGLWGLVQCGFKAAASKRIKEGETVDEWALTSLRRCINEGVKKDIEGALQKRMGESAFAKMRADAATNELLMEMREAVKDKRDPDESLVRELLALGAKPEAKHVALGDDSEDEWGEAWDEEGSEAEGGEDEEDGDSDDSEDSY